MKQSFVISPYQFFLCKDGEYVAWNCQTHKQFALTPEHLDRLREWSSNPPKSACSLDYDLLGEKFLIPKQDDKSSSWGSDVLSQLFHVGTSSVPTSSSEQTQEQWIQEYQDYSAAVVEQAPPRLFIERTGPFFALPEANVDLISSSLMDACTYRKTSRNFLQKSLPLDLFSTILFVCFGHFHKNTPSELEAKGFHDFMLRKTTPSAGGLHCNEAYICMQNVNGIEPGIYHYSVQRHGLTLIRPWNEPLQDYLHGQFFANNCAFGVFITAYLEKLWAKYPHSRSYRVALLDSGHLSQMFQLTVAGLQLDSWMTGAFDDHAVEQLLKLDGPHQAPLLFVAAGFGEHTSIPRAFLQELGSKSAE